MEEALIFYQNVSRFRHSKKNATKEDEIGYLIVFGIAPYFHNELKKFLNESSFVVIGFDESLNKVAQKGQMDVTVRFCMDDGSPSKNSTVTSRYFGSAFLGHATAYDLLNSFLLVTKDIDPKKVLQISMDGPNVNLKFLSILKEHLSEEGSPIVLDIGSCDLHILNNAFS